MMRPGDWLRLPRSLWAEHVSPRYAALQQREQRLLLTAAVVLPLLLFAFGLWLPLRDDIQSVRSSIPQLMAESAEAKLLADRAAGGTAGARHGGDLLAGVEASASAAGVRRYITRIKPQPGFEGQAVLVQLRKAPYGDAVRFLSAMAEWGAGTQQARLSGEGGHGLVDADITFSAQ